MVFVVARIYQAALLVFVAAVSAHAIETPVLSSPPNPVGAGARATGIGSAFIAIADDATAASWNPAGLVQLDRAEASLVGRWSYHQNEIGTFVEEFDDERVRVDAGSDSFDAFDLNFASVALPFSWRQRYLIVSLNYQQMFSFDRELDFRATQSGQGIDTIGQFYFDQHGGIDAISPAIAGELTRSLWAGAALNFWRDGLGRSNAWAARLQQAFTTSVAGAEFPREESVVTNVFHGLHGTSATLGLLWDSDFGIRLGVVADLAFLARLDLASQFRDRDAGEVFPPTRQRIRLSFPPSYGAGIAWRPMDRAVLSFDLTYVEWGQFRRSDASGRELLITGDPAETFAVDSVLTVRAGFEYLATIDEPVIALRTGVFLDPEPSRGSPEQFFGGSVGCGFSWSLASVDLAYQLRAGMGVSPTSIVGEILRVPAAEIDAFQHALYFSTVWYL